MEELKELIPTAEETKRTTKTENIDKDIEKGIKSIISNIQKAKEQGRRDCWMYGYSYWVEDTLITLFIEKGYRIKKCTYHSDGSDGYKILW